MIQPETVNESVLECVFYKESVVREDVREYSLISASSYFNEDKTLRK